MAFRRSFKMTRSSPYRSRKALTRSAANRKFARSKKQWVVAVNTQCHVQGADPLSNCPNGGNIILLSNDDIRAQLEDATRVVAISGDVWIVPFIPAFPSIQQSLAYAAVASCMFRMGLRKDTVFGNAPAAAQTPPYNPLASGDTEFARGDYTEGSWLRLWNELWFPGGTLGLLEQPYTCCSDVSGGSSVNALTDGTGNIDTSISTECSPCTPPEDKMFQQAVTVKIWEPKRFRINVKRPLNLKEDNALHLWYGWEMMSSSSPSTRITQGPVGVWGGIRLLLEK